MANKKISELTELTTPTDADIVPIVDSATTKKISWANIKATLKSWILGDIQMMSDSMFYQALINGNFDVWQRGTSIAMTAADAYTADRWYAETATAGTDKTVSRQDGTGVAGSYYCARVAMVQDVDELLTFSQALESQDSIKFRGQKLTLSFWARGGAEFVADNPTLVCKIVTGKGTDQKVLAFTTSADAISANETLTTGWQKFTITTTAVIASDITQIGISFAFTHAGSGTTTNYFEVAQVQLCAGDVALPFQAKSFEEELRMCQRFYEKSYNYSVIPGTNDLRGVSTGYTYPDNNGWAASGVVFQVRKRTNPTMTFWSTAGTIWAATLNVNTDLAGGGGTNAAETSEYGYGSLYQEGCYNTKGVLRSQWVADAEF